MFGIVNPFDASKGKRAEEIRGKGFSKSAFRQVLPHTFDLSRQRGTIHRMTGAVLDQFLEEVVSQGAEVLLPQNLPEKWFELLLDESQAFIDDEEDCAGMLAAVMTILNHQQGCLLEQGRPLEVETKRLFTCMEYYAVCLAVEEVSRQTDIRGEPPTLDNIFDDTRDIEFTRVKNISQK